MDVTGPSTLPRGSKLTLSTSGAQGDVSATISFGGMSVSLTVMSAANLVEGDSAIYRHAL